MWICVPFFISSNCSSNLIVSRGLLVDATCTQPFCTFVPKNKKLGVGGYTEEVLEWFNYSRASAHPGCEVSCQGVPNQPASSLRLCFVEVSLTVEKAVSC